MATAQTVADELKKWLSNITQPFGINGETGIDIGLPYHTPVYAVTSGPVVGAGYYGGGGVISVDTPINYKGINGPASIYYQHLSDELVKVGDMVHAGELIGYSGGQIGYGDHPSSTKFSSGPHIEIGINAPYGANGIWHNMGPNVNPLGFFQALEGSGGNTVLDAFGPFGNIPNPLQGAQQGAQDITQAISQLANDFNPANIASGFASGIFSGLSNLVTAPFKALGITSPQDALWRTSLILTGALLIIIGLVALVLDFLDKSNVEVAGTRV